MPLTESSWQRGQTRRPPPPERDSQGEPGTAAATLRPGPGTTARAPRCLFGCGQLPAAAAQQPCARAQAPPGGRLVRHGAAVRASAAGPSSPRAGTNFLPPGPPGRAGWQAAPSPGCLGLRRPAPSPGVARFLPALTNPEPRAGASRSPRLRSNKAGGRAETRRGAGSGGGAPEPGEGTPGPGEGSAKGQRGRGGQRKGKKVSCSRRESLLCSSSPPGSPGLSAAGGLGGGGGDGGAGRADAGAWRAGCSLTSVQSERLDHCQCRHVCRGSRRDARLQHQQPLVVRKRGGDWGRGRRGKTARRGRRREGGRW